MYEVRVQIEFRASHQVRMYDGALEPRHEHLWMAEAVLRGPDLDSIGVLVDFVAVRQALEAAVAPLVGRHLNEASVLAGLNPTAEHLARRLWETLRARLPAGTPLSGVVVREAPGCFAAYFDDPSASPPQAARA